MKRQPALALIALALTLAGCGGGQSSSPTPPVTEPLAVTTASVPDMTWGVPVTVTFAATGGSAPYTWSVVGVPHNVIPDGLTFTAAGVLSGIPAVSGSNRQITVAVTDSRQQTANKSFTYAINNPNFAIATTSLPPARAGVPYQVTLALTPNDGSPIWAANNMPGGMTLNSSSGTINWTPTATGDFTFTVISYFDSTLAVAATRDLTLTVVGTSAAARNDSIATATPLGSGRVRASFSPYADLSGNVSPDQDFYKVTAVGGATVQIETFASRLTDLNSPADTVIEVLDASGQRFSTCQDPFDDAPAGLPIAVDPSPWAYDQACINDDLTPGVIDSRLTFRVPGTASQPVTFYSRAFDWSGNARPDFIYDLSISGTGIQ